MTDGGSNSDKRQRPKLGVKVERMFGCRCHSGLRKAVIEQHGERIGWEPFGQWSLKKAQELARKEADRLNGISTKTTSGRSPPVSSISTSSDGGLSEEGWTSASDGEERSSTTNSTLPSMCNNGSCTWKIKTKYDNIYAEIHGRSESDDED